MVCFDDTPCRRRENSLVLRPMTAADLGSAKMRGKQMKEQSAFRESIQESGGIFNPPHPPDIRRRHLFRAWWVTSRMEYLPDAIIHVVLPLVLVLRHEPLSEGLLQRSGWGLLVWLFGHWIGSSLNCVA